MSKVKAKASKDQLPPELRRKISRLHKQMAAAEAAGGVQPPPVLNRRTGEEHTFGPRRAYDGAWVIEMLGASGCTKPQVDAAIFALEPLIERGVKIDGDLLKLLRDFHDPVPLEQRRQVLTDFKRKKFRIVE